MDTASQNDRRRHGEQDYTFARLPTAFLHDPRIARLTAAARWFYVALYLFANEKRVRSLPPDVSDAQTCSIIARVDPRSAAKMLQDCIAAGLLTRTPEGALTVANIDEYAHGNARFRDVPKPGNPPQLPGNPRKEKRTEQIQNRAEDMAASRCVREAHATPPEQPTPAAENARASGIMAQIGLDLSADRSPPASASMEPDAASVAREIAALAPHVADRRRCIGLATGKATPSWNHVFDRALFELPEAAFLDGCAYTCAWRLANERADKDMAGAVLCNRFKAALPAEVTA
jgi:hypothetical protein